MARGKGKKKKKLYMIEIQATVRENTLDMESFLRDLNDWATQAKEEDLIATEKAKEVDSPVTQVMAKLFEETRSQGPLALPIIDFDVWQSNGQAKDSASKIKPVEIVGAVPIMEYSEWRQQMNLTE